MATVLHVKLAVVWVAMVVALAGAVLVAHPGTGITTLAVVKLVVLEAAHPVAPPVPLMGIIYQL